MDPGPLGSFDDLDALLAASAADNSAAPDSTAAPDLTAPLELSTVTPELAAALSTSFNATMTGQYLTPNDTLQLSCWNSNPNLSSVSAFLRFLQPDGTLLIQALTIQQLTSDRTHNIATLPQAEGVLVGIVMQPPGTATYRGQCFVAVDILTGSAASPVTTLRLLSDYLSSGFLPNWPDGVLRSATEGDGFHTVYLATNPPPGAEFTINQPAGTRWRVYGWGGILETSSTAGNRVVQVTFQDGPVGSGGQIVFLASLPAPVTPSQFAALALGAGMGPVSPSIDAQAGPLPSDMYMVLAGQVFGSVTGLSTTDRWLGVTVSVEEWIDV